MDYLKEYIEKITLLQNEYALGTVRNYQATYNHLLSFIQTKKYQDIPLENIDFKFINDFDYFLKTEITFYHTQLDQNTANKYYQKLKKILTIAKKENLLKENLYEKFTFKYSVSIREFLTQEEIDSLIQHSLGDNISLQKV